MKNRLALNLGLLLYAIAILLVAAIAVQADTINFDQCIQVINLTTGNLTQALTCTFTDTLNYTNNTAMFLSGTNYCYTITSRYPPGAYTYFANCSYTTASAIANVTGTFTVDQHYNAGTTPNLAPTTIQPQTSQTSWSKLWKELQESAKFEIFAFAIVAIIAWLLNTIFQKKR